MQSGSGRAQRGHSSCMILRAAPHPHMQAFVQVLLLELD